MSFRTLYTQPNRSIYSVLRISTFVLIIHAISVTGSQTKHTHIPRDIVPDPDLHHTQVRDVPAGYPFLITGVTSGRTAFGSVPTRREISELQLNDPDLFNLYLLGLQNFQSMNETDPLSFYQIAGIHGRPFAVWQGADGIPGKSAGYCPHSNTMFMGWHRAYLALYEQLLYTHIQYIASQFPPALQPRYQAAAQDFRIPYWDWAVMRIGTNDSLPPSIASSTITITGTNGQLQNISNPLHHFDFHPCSPDPGSFEGIWNLWNQTLRYPTTNTPTASSQDNLLVARFNSGNRNIHDGIAGAFSASGNFNTFSLTGIEIWHNLVHLYAGGVPPDNPYNGHMVPLDYSAFDPMFMLHHCNVDRLYSLYQNSRPNSPLLPQSLASSGTFALADNTTVDANTSLSPFWKTSTTFWTTADLWDTRALGYAYPETRRWEYANEEAFEASVNASIAVLYSTSVRERVGGSDGIGGVAKESETEMVNESVFTDWKIDVSAPRPAFGSSFLMRFSLGGKLGMADTEVGTWSVLVADASTAGNGTSGGDIAEGSVSLTASLLDEVVAGELECLDPDRVVPFLKRRLSWKIFLTNGTVVTVNCVKGLRVGVSSTNVTIPQDPKILLAYNGMYDTHPDILADKAGCTES